MAATSTHAEQEPLVPSPLIGRDELNLAEFPIALLADYAPKGMKTLCFKNGQGQLTVTGSDKYGLPTAADTDVIVALVYLTKLRNDFQDVKVNFSRYELIKLLGWNDEGDSYKRLDLSFNRWGGVWLVYDKCWWDNRQKKNVSAKMHILESVIFAEPGARNRDGQAYLPLSTFTWNSAFIESCQADNLRQLDLDEYFSLKSAVAKRLYRFLGKRFYLQRDWTFDLREIAFERVGLSRSYTDAGKIKEKLQPAIEELEAIGFLKPLSRDDRYSRIDRGQWTIRLSRRSPALATPHQSSPATEPESPLIAELVSRGVTKATAAELVQQFSERIAQKLEVFDWLKEKQDKRIGKSPEGYLCDSIRKDYATPKGFISAADRQRREQERQTKEREAAEARRREREEKAREKTERQAIEAYWEALTPEQQAELQAAADAQTDPKQLAEETGPLKRIGQHIRRHDYIRRILQSRPAEA